MTPLRCSNPTCRARVLVDDQWAEQIRQRRASAMQRLRRLAGWVIDPNTTDGLVCGRCAA